MPSPGLGHFPGLGPVPDYGPGRKMVQPRVVPVMARPGPAFAVTLLENVMTYKCSFDFQYSNPASVPHHVKDSNCHL